MNRTKLFSRPHVEVYENFLTEEECTKVLDLLKEHEKHYAKSLGYNHDECASIITSHRTSSSISDSPDYLRWLKEKIINEIVSEHLPHLTVDCCEAIQSQRYDVGEYYRPHLDYFNIPGYDEVTPNDRVCTVIVYLNDDFEGGTTKFQELKLEIQPKRGAAAFFDYSMESAYIKRKTYHSGEPVTRGTKYIITAWIRSRAITEGDIQWDLRATATK